MKDEYLIVSALCHVIFILTICYDARDQLRMLLYINYDYKLRKNRLSYFLNFDLASSQSIICFMG